MPTPRPRRPRQRDATPLDDDFRDEAKRLRAVSRADQRAVVAMQRAIAADPRVPKPDRDHARRRAATLARLLRIPTK